MAADVPTMSDMDAFLINPTVKMSREYVRRTADEWMPYDQLLLREAGKPVDESKDVIRDFSHKFIFPREYEEEEETTTSPSDDTDGSAFGSTSSEGDADSTFSIEDIIDEYDSLPAGLPLCSKAQPVYIISAGKARVISVTSSADSSPVNNSPRSISEEFEGTFAIFGSSKTHQRSQLASNYSRTRSPERRIDPTRAIPTRQSSQPLPRLDATSTAGPTLAKTSQTPLASQRADLVKQDPFPADWPLPASPISPTIPRRRMPRLFTANSRRKISDASDSSAGSSSDSNSTYLVPVRGVATARTLTPLAIDTAHKSLYESPRRQKLVPRGAAERAPTITLPPYNDGQWPLRSTALPEHREPSALRDLRRKSAVATSQF